MGCRARLVNWRESLKSGTLNYNLRDAGYCMGILMSIARTLNFRRFYAPGTAYLIGLMILACAGALVAAPQRAGKAKPPVTAPLKVSPAPFRVGEVLNYSGQWLKMNDVVAARLSVVDDHLFNGHAAWHFQAQLQTKNPLRYLFPLDDQFDSYSSHSDFAGMQFEMYLHQPGKQENRILRLSSTSAPAPDGATLAQVLPGTMDALGFVYYLRTVNWNKTPNVRMPVFDGHKLYEIRASIGEAHREVRVLAGTFVATGIALHVFEHDVEATEIKVTIWLAQDAAHTPVLFEAELPFGVGRGELAPVPAN